MPGWECKGMTRAHKLPIALTCVAAFAFGQTPRYPAQSVVKIVAEEGHGFLSEGSGVVVGECLVATNAHVTAGALSVKVVSGSQSWTVHSRKDDLHRDLSVLFVPTLLLPACPLVDAGNAPPYLGQAVTAIGFPSGHGPTTTLGSITGLWSYLGASILQTNAAIAPGSSGGGLFDSEGRLLGLTTFIFGKSSTIEFSIPVRWIRELMDDPAARPAPVAVAKELLMTRFLDLMDSDPANQPNWGAFTKEWAKSAPADPDAWFAYGNSLEASTELRQVQERIEAYHHSLTLRAESPKAWNNLGVSLGLVNRSQESEAAFLKALALDPAYALAWLNLGSVRLDANRPFEAVEALRRGLELQPDDARAWEHLAEAEMNLKQPAEAIRHFRIALGLSPFHGEWWAELARACTQARDEPGFQQALLKLSALDPARAKALAKELERRTARP